MAVVGLAEDSQAAGVIPGPPVAQGAVGVSLICRRRHETRPSSCLKQFNKQGFNKLPSKAKLETICE